MRVVIAILCAAGCSRDESTDSAGSSSDLGADSGLDGGTDTRPTGSDPVPGPATAGSAETCAVLFGGNDRVRAPDEGLPLGTESRTAQAWIRTRSLRDQVAISHGRPSPEQGFLVGTDQGRAMVRTGNGGERLLGERMIADDRWHHLAAAWDGRLAILVVDGEVDAVGDLEGSTLEGDLVAGNTPTGDNTAPWIGWLDDVKLIHGARPPDEIAADPDGELLHPSDVLVWWDFEGLPEAGGPKLTVPDVSGHGYEGLTAGEEGRPWFPACR